MPLFDMPLEAMRQYRPAREEPADFDAFWADTLAETRAHDLNAVFEPADFGLTTLDVYDVSFSGYNGDRIKGWYMRPRGARGPFARRRAIHRLFGGRGYPHEWLPIPSAGFASLVMDTRGQGSARRGDTPDVVGSHQPSVSGKMTQGILDPKDLLLPPPVQRCCARGRSDTQPRRCRLRPDRGRRRQPGRRLWPLPPPV